VYVYTSNESQQDVLFDNMGVTQITGPVLEETHYYPFGLTMAGISTTAPLKLENRFKFNGKELNHKEFNDGTGLEWYDYGARLQDPQVGKWWAIDPLAGKFPWQSPYVAMDDNPILKTDPTGMAASPIYDLEGNFLGTDNQGLQGQAIVMNKADFTQGMEHAEAEKKDLGFAALKDYDKSIVKLWNNFNGLKNRPDYDGFVTIQEGVDWAKSHPGALQNPTLENMLYIDASKLDFGNITTADFKNGVGKSSPINLFNAGNVTASASNATLRATVYALGRVDMTLLDNNGTVSIVNDFNKPFGRATDYDWNKGGGFWRSTFISYERWRANLTDADGFRTYYYGTGTLNKFIPMPEPGIGDGRLP